MIRAKAEPRGKEESSLKDKIKNGIFNGLKVAAVGIPGYFAAKYVKNNYNPKYGRQMVSWARDAYNQGPVPTMFNMTDNWFAESESMAIKPNTEYLNRDVVAKTLETYFKDRPIRRKSSRVKTTFRKPDKSGVLTIAKDSNMLELPSSSLRQQLAIEIADRYWQRQPDAFMRPAVPSIFLTPTVEQDIAKATAQVNLFQDIMDMKSSVKRSFEIEGVGEFVGSKRSKFK